MSSLSPVVKVLIKSLGKEKDQGWSWPSPKALESYRNTCASPFLAWSFFVVCSLVMCSRLGLADCLPGEDLLSSRVSLFSASGWRPCIAQKVTVLFQTDSFKLTWESTHALYELWHNLQIILTDKLGVHGQSTCWTLRPEHFRWKLGSWSFLKLIWLYDPCGSLTYSSVD